MAFFYNLYFKKPCVNYYYTHLSFKGNVNGEKLLAIVNIIKLL